MYLLAAINKPNKLAACLLGNIFLLAVSSQQKELTSCLLWSLVDPEGGGNKCFRNVEKYSPDYSASHPRE
jgi:hypothetical protein